MGAVANKFEYMGGGDGRSVNLNLDDARLNKLLDC